MLDLGVEVRQFEENECMYQWRTDEHGLIVVTKEDGSQFVPTLTGKYADVMSSVIARWGDTVRPIAEQFGIVERWILAMIYQESGGNPRAFRREPNGWTGIGLLQITHPSLKGGHTDEQLFDPQLNLTIGARYIKQIAGRDDVKWDWPRVAATFNAGSPRPNPKSQWNLFCYGNHVDAEVAAQNYCVLRAMTPSEHPAPLFDLTADAWDGAHAGPLREDDEPITKVEGIKPV